MGSLEIPSAINVAVDRLAQATGAEQIILFGSRARGDHHDDSDWDICVVLPDEVGFGQFTPSKLYPLVSGLGEAIQVYPLRKSIFEEARKQPTSISRDVADDGVVLYRRGDRGIEFGVRP